MARRVKYTIDLNEVFKRAYKDRTTEFRSKLKLAIFDPAIRRAYGMKVIDSIFDRTKKQKIDKHGKSMGKYTKGYANSLFGQVYGKRAGARVNLYASGEMLSSMIAKESQKTKVTIELLDQEQNDKAHGHINGYQNRDPRKRRDFLGLPKKEEEKILKDILQNRGQALSLNLLAASFATQTQVSQKPVDDVNKTVTLDQPNLLGEYVG